MSVVTSSLTGIRLVEFNLVIGVGETLGNKEHSAKSHMATSTPTSNEKSMVDSPQSSSFPLDIDSPDSKRVRLSFFHCETQNIEQLILTNEMMLILTAQTPVI